MLQLEQVTDEEWFSDFELLEGTLTKCLLLIAVMTSQGLVDSKEATSFKQLLLAGKETRNDQVLKSFLRSKSLFTLLRVLRGQLGLPRTRRSDSNPKSRSHKASPVMKKGGSLGPKLNIDRQYFSP